MTADVTTHQPELRLDGDHDLLQEDIDRFRASGHTIVRGLCSPAEAAAAREVIVDAAERYNEETRPLDQRDTYGKAFLQIMNLWARDEQVRRFTLARRFAKVAAELLGVDGVRIYHDQALFKEPGGGPTPWHQDQFYWPLDTDSTITMWMPLMDVSEDMGTLTFASGSHRSGYLGDWEISDESQRVFDEMVAREGFRLETHGAMAAGDATFHAGWVLHTAPGNTTDRRREVMTVIYHADGARVTEAQNPSQVTDIERWLPGLRAGDLAASELNPLVYGG